MKTNPIVSRWLLSLSISLVASSAWATTYNTTFTFDTPTEVGTAPAHGAWYPDRYRPAAFESYSFNGQNVLKVGIDGINDDASGRAASGQQGTFYNTQGRKLDLPAGTTALSAKLFVPADWLTSHRRADLWATGNDTSAYPIIGFANVDGAAPVIRYWTDEGWVNTAIAPVSDTWYRFEIVLNNDGKFDYLVNGEKVGATTGTVVSTSLSNAMVQAYNFNDPALPEDQRSAESYESYWDDLGYAYPSYDTTLTFDTPTEVGAAQAPGVWYPDRYRPDAFESYSFDGQNVLKVGIDGIDDSSSERAESGRQGTFYNTQGRKLDLPTGTTALSAKLFVPADWLTSHRRSDLWATGSDTSVYPIIGFANVDGATPVIRYWTDEGWVNTEITPAGNTWYRFEILLNSKGRFDYLVNGVLVGETTGTTVSTYLSNAIVQAYNFNDAALPEDQQSADSYEAYWDDVGFTYPGIQNITDHTAYSTLGAAVAAADPGDVITLAPRSYTEAPVTIDKAVTILGANHGVAGTDTRTDESRILDTNLTITAPGVVIDGVEIVHTDDTGNAVLLTAAAEVSNSIIKRTGVNAGQFSRGITTSVGLSGYTITGNLFTGDSSGGFFSGHKTWNSGMYVNGGAGTITGNTFENCRSAINLDDFNSGITLTGNTFRTSGTYLSFGGVTPTTGAYTIAGNEFFLDWANLTTNWLPSTLFNNSNVDVGFRINAIANTFGGVASGDLTNSQKFQIESRMYHRGRSNRNGVIDYLANEQIVMPGTTIASAVAAASAGDTITVGSGTYAVDATVALNKSDLTIQGVPGAVITGSIATGAEFFNVSAPGVTLKDLTIQKTDKPGVQQLIYVGADDLTVTGCDLSGQYVLGDPDVSRAFVVTYGITGLTIDGNTIHGLRQPGYLNGSEDSPTTGTISNNLVSGTRGWVIDGAQMNFTGNSWSGNAVDIAILAATPFGDPDPTYLLSDLIAANNGANISDQRVGANPFNVKNLRTNATFGTITAAINAATDGDSLALEPGTYSEGALNVDKKVTILGSNHGVAGNIPRINESKLSNTSLTISAAGAVIDGVVIDQTNDTADAILLTAAAEISNSIIKRTGVNAGQSSRGITTSVGLSGYAITGNLFTGDASGGFFSGHKSWNSGMYVNGGAGSITGNTFENCRTAINLDDFNANIAITDNTFRTSGTYLSFGGVTPTKGSRTIAGNEFTLDWANIDTNWLPSALFNNSNVNANFRINAIDNTFGGVASGDLTNAQKFQIEARMSHRGRGGKLGVVDFVANEQIVMPGTTIASAITAASAGDTVRVGPGTYSEDLLLNKSVTLQGEGPGKSTIVGPIGGNVRTVKISASDAVLDGFTITRVGNNATDWNNADLNTIAVALQGQSFTGARVSNNELTGCRTGIDVNDSNGHTIRNNVITNNRTGMIFHNQTDNLLVTENEITNNWTIGVLFLDGSDGTNSPVQSAVDSKFTNNNISGNWYGQIVDRQTGGSLPAPGQIPKDFELNWLGTTAPNVTTGNSKEPGYSAQIPEAFGGTATAPFSSQPDILGAASKNILIQPFLATGIDTDLTKYGFQGDMDSIIHQNYDHWLSTAFPNLADRNNPDVSGANATPAGDGITNLMKYALGLEPLANGFDSLPKIATQDGYLTMTYRKNKQATDVRYIVQASSSLDAWSVTDIVVSQKDMGGYWDVTVRDTVPQAEQPERFMRLSVEK